MIWSWIWHLPQLLCGCNQSIQHLSALKKQTTHFSVDSMQIRNTWRHVPSCKEYSRSKVTSHMPLKAVIFHRNVVQPPREECTAQRSARRGSVLDWVCADAPRRCLQPWSHTLPAPRNEPRRKYRLCSLFSPPLTGTGCRRPTPGVLMMRRDGEVRANGGGDQYYAHWVRCFSDKKS